MQRDGFSIRVRATAGFKEEQHAHAEYQFIV